jgi:hypothetical protein
MGQQRLTRWKQERKIERKYGKRKNKQKKKKHRIIVIGDSHARGCATEFKSNLDKNFDVQGFVYPGAAGLSTIISSAKRDIQQLPKQDVVVVWGGGGKGCGKNETKQGINWIMNFVEANHHTNIIILEAPHRHD